MLQKPVPHFINSRIAGIKAEKCGPKLIMSANSFYACRRRKRTNSSPSGRVPSSLTKFSPEERTACVIRQTITWSQTPGMRPDSEDSMPKRRTLCSSPSPCCFHKYLFSSFPLFSFFLFSLTAFVRLHRARLTHTSLKCTSIIPGGFLIRSLLLLFPEHQAHHICFFPYVPFLRHYMHRYDFSFGQAGLSGSCVYAPRSR